jgi:hypothetical protein
VGDSRSKSPSIEGIPCQQTPRHETDVRDTFERVCESGGQAEAVRGAAQEVQRTASRRSGPRAWLRAVEWLIAAGQHLRANATTLRIAEDLAARMDYDTGHVRYGLDDMVARLGISKPSIKRHVAYLRELGALAWVVHGTKANIRRALGMTGYAGTATVYAATIPAVYDHAMGHRIVGTGYEARLVRDYRGQAPEPVDNLPADDTGSETREPPSLRVVKEEGQVQVVGGSNYTPRTAARGTASIPHQTDRRSSSQDQARRRTPVQVAREIQETRMVRALVNWTQTERNLRRLAFVLRPFFDRGLRAQDIAGELHGMTLGWRPARPVAFIRAQLADRPPATPNSPQPTSACAPPRGRSRPPRPRPTGPASRPCSPRWPPPSEPTTTAGPPASTGASGPTSPTTTPPTPTTPSTCTGSGSSPTPSAKTHSSATGRSPMSEPTTAGADLARMALQAARRSAKTKPATGRLGRAKRTRGARGDGRDPMPLGAALTRLMDEHGWDTAVTGGNIIDRWNELCPELAGKVQPVAYDPERGILELRPGSHAHATQLRWLERQLCQRINTKLGQTAVRSLRVLAVAAIVGQPAVPAANPAPAPAAAAPVRTPETASPGYQHARAVALEHKPDRTQHLTAHARAAIERQNEALRARREPEAAFTEAAAQAEILAAQHDSQPPTSTPVAAANRDVSLKPHDRRPRQDPPHRLPILARCPPARGHAPQRVARRHPRRLRRHPPHSRRLPRRSRRDG